MTSLEKPVQVYGALHFNQYGSSYLNSVWGDLFIEDYFVEHLGTFVEIHLRGERLESEYSGFVTIGPWGGLALKTNGSDSPGHFLDFKQHGILSGYLEYELIDIEFRVYHDKLRVNNVSLITSAEYNESKLDNGFTKSSLFINSLSHISSFNDQIGTNNGWMLSCRGG